MGLKLNQEEKFQIFLLFHKIEILKAYTILHIHNPKKKGQTFYEQFSNIFIKASIELQTIYLVPLIENTLTKNNIIKKEFQNYQSILLKIKTELEKKKKDKIWIFKEKLFILWNLETKRWLIKNLTINKKTFELLFLFKENFSYKKRDEYYEESAPNFLKTTLYKLLISYMLNDLVCLKKLAF